MAGEPHESAEHIPRQRAGARAGEAVMMGKEHFIETFGVPAYTISLGGSGGALYDSGALS
jgi:hypothetical protein